MREQNTHREKNNNKQTQSNTQKKQNNCNSWHRNRKIVYLYTSNVGVCSCSEKKEHVK